MNEREFYRVLASWQSRPFDWQSANCVHFASDVTRRAWGIEFDVPHCETPAEAAEWIRAQGARSLYAFLRRLFGQPVAPLQARRGFIAYRKGVGLEGMALGVVERKALFVSERGLIELPLGEIAGAFDPGKYRG
jgi:hypothetical protein